jgi:hypothetical protein
MGLSDRNVALHLKELISISIIQGEESSSANRQREQKVNIWPVRLQYVAEHLLVSRDGLIQFSSGFNPTFTRPTKIYFASWTVIQNGFRKPFFQDSE